MKQIHIWAAIVCLLLASCSDIRFGDDFLGDHPESSGATLDEMFSSAVNADRVLTKAYTYLPYGLPTGDRPDGSALAAEIDAILKEGTER